MKRARRNVSVDRRDIVQWPVRDPGNGFRVRSFCEPAFLREARGVGNRARAASLTHLALLILVLMVVAVPGCSGYRIAKPECGPQHPEDCVYLLKVRGAIPWRVPGE